MADYTRREFTGLLVAGAAACWLPGCAGPYDGEVTPINGSAVLSYKDFPKLRAVGGSAVVNVRGQFPIVVVRTSDGAAVATSATCTHAGCLLRYESGPRDIFCDCHGANFGLDGAVLGGPTTIPLPTYVATLSADAVRVQIVG